MGIEGGSSNNEVQNQEINQSTNEQIEQNQAEHQRSGEELEGNSTIDNEGERKQIEGKDDATDFSEDESSQLDNDDSIESDNSQEQPAESEAVSPEQQQLDNQDTIEGDASSANEMSENNQEITDSLDGEDSIEDEDLSETDDTEENEGTTESLDQDDSIEDDDSNDVDDAEEDTEDSEGSLDLEDSIEDEDTTEVDGENAEDAEADGNNVEDIEADDEDVEDTEADGENADDTEADSEDTEADSENAEDTVADDEDVEDTKTDSENAKADGENAEDTVADGEAEDVGEKENPEGYHDVGEFNDELNGIYSDESMSNQEKVDAAKECVDKLNHSDLSPEEKKQSVDAPSDARALKNPENSDWTEKTDDNPWPPLNIDFPDKMGLDYDEDITPIGREEGNAQLPDIGFRYGGEGGYNYTCENAEGNVPTLDERALPKEYVPEKEREVHFDNGRYCDAIDAISSFESDPASSLDYINGMIDDINAERGTNIQHLDADELEALSDRYQQLQDTEFADVRDELGTDDRDFTKYGVHGYAKPMEDASGDIICEGRADQFNTALPEYMLKRIGVEY